MSPPSHMEILCGETHMTAKRCIAASRLIEHVRIACGRVSQQLRLSTRAQRLCLLVWCPRSPIWHSSNWHSNCGQLLQVAMTHLICPIFALQSFVSVHALLFYLVERNRTQAWKMSCSSAKMRNPWAARQCDHFMASVYAQKSAGALFEKQASKLPSEEKQRQAIAEGVHTAKTCQSSVFGIFECSHRECNDKRVAG